MYDENYYKTNNYENYLNKSERYQKLALEITSFCDNIKILKETNTILDYGCAVGFLMDGFSNILNIKTFGFDISPWALSKVNNKHIILNYQDIFKQTFDFVFILDVLEHMSDDQINDLLSKINTNKIFVRIPVASFGKDTFFLEISRADKTHINCKDKPSWINFFKKFGFSNHIKLNLNNIYDSEGVLCALFYKGELYE